MGNLYVFGDSFTRCDGTGAGPLIDNVENLPTWPEYIQKQLKLHKLFNFGGQGACNDEILLYLISNLGELKKGDVVIVGQTFLERTPYLLRTPDDPYVDVQWDWLNRVSGLDVSVNDTFPESLQEYYKEITESHMSDTFVSSQAYIANVKLRTPYLWIRYYQHRFEELGKYLKKIGVEFYLWDVPTEAPLFESIEQYTKGKVDDGHWSWNGNVNFGKKLLRQIEKARKLKK